MEKLEFHWYANGLSLTHSFPTIRRQQKEPQDCSWMISLEFFFRYIYPFVYGD